MSKEKYPQNTSVQESVKDSGNQELPSTKTDLSEKEFTCSSENEKIIPTRHYHSLPVVGLGGSAGALTALHAFFSNVPEKTGMAFVVVLHLSPDHESSLAAILQRSTLMPVIQVTGTVRLEADRIYVIPPAHHLRMTDGHVALSDLDQPRGRRVAVDLFFRTLADTHGPHSVAIVLSGGDSDGASGIKRIKEKGGLTIAQDPMEAEHNGMPRSAIETGMIDWVLVAGDIPKRLMEYTLAGSSIQLPSEKEPEPTDGQQDESVLKEILNFLHARTGRDFSYYKRATVLRRLARRMQVNNITELSSYLAFVRTHPGEIGALLQDLLISVTNFFRDRHAFEELNARIPDLFRDKKSKDQVRVWVTACATGEEAYSVAIMLSEYASTLELPPQIQVFATDIDEEAIHAARDGVYPETIAADVSEERLRRFFIRDHGHFRVKREIRERVLFAVHDLLKDSPFSRLDLICCRNLLIYLNRDAQGAVFEIFHFSLRPDGRLFLGSSESAEEARSLFTALDKAHRIYARRASHTHKIGLPALGGPIGPHHFHPKQDVTEGTSASVEALNLSRSASHLLKDDGRKTSWEGFHFKLIERFMPPSVVINAEHEIVHLSEHGGRFLKFFGGKASMNLLRVVHPMLRIELRTALFRATQSCAMVKLHGIPMEEEGARKVVDITVYPSSESDPEFLLVIFEEHLNAESDPRLSAEPASVVQHLEHENDHLKDYLRDTVEQYEASMEELKASNEELQAMNEELRAATEELETSREELQSINEELTTVNQELKSKVEEISHANSDLQNLMSSTHIATIFLDRDLRIKRYTPSAVELFNLIATDVGRPLSDLSHRLEYDSITDDAERVLTHLVTSERQVRAQKGRHFLARMLPYRTIEDHIAGVVLNLVDITEHKMAQEALLESRAELRSLGSQSAVGIAQCDRQGLFAYVNDRFCEMAGRSRDELIGQLSLEDVAQQQDGHHGLPLVHKICQTGKPVQSENHYIRPDGSEIWVINSVAPIFGESGATVGCTAICVDISDRKQAEDALTASRMALEQSLFEIEEAKKAVESASKTKDHFLAVLSHELRTPLTPVLIATHLLACEENLSDDGRESLETIERNVMLETCLIDDLLDITRISRGKMEIVQLPLDLHEAAHKALAICNPEIKAKNQQIEVNLNAKKSFVRGDFVRIQQVVWNLLKNASKFTNRGGKITLSTVNDREQVVLMVTDDGIGISAEALPTLFEAFRQADVSITRQFGGLGLGLAIAKAVVDAHGGKLTVKSEGKGKGASFILTMNTAPE
jgi:two-component system, chemotaxis family, CheB/CheR fusion protein